MELRHLRYFITVAEEENIHRAAKRLNISQPPLSLAIQQLEEEIDANLFERNGRGIQITRAGKAFLKKAYQIIHDSNQAKLDAYNISNGIGGIIKIGFVSSAITGLLQNKVSQFKKAYPNLHLEITQSTNNLIPEQLLKGQLDVGILRMPEILQKGLIMRYEEKEGWLAAIHKNHLLSKKENIYLEDLNRENIIFYPRTNSPTGYDDIMSRFKKKKIDITKIQEATEQMTIAGLVGSEVGIGIVPECMAKIKIENVMHRPIAEFKDITSLAIITRDETDDILEEFY